MTRPDVAGRMCGIGDEAAAGIDGQVAAQRQAGMRAVEIRTIDGRGIHQLTDRQVAAAAEAIADAGLIVPVVDTPIGGWAVTVRSNLDAELAVLRRAAIRARAFGCRRLRVMSYPNDGRAERGWRAEALVRMNVLTSAAEDLGVVLLHENCQGWASRSPDQTLEMLFDVNSPYLRLIFDIGNGLSYGYEAPAFLKAVLPWVDHVHVKDGLRTGAAGRPVYTLPGAGEAGLAVCIDMLERHGYRGWYSIEPGLAFMPHQQIDGGPEAKAGFYRLYAEAFEQMLTALASDADDTRSKVLI